ncbi:tyrosine-type recombinase/integrase [Staphylococcus saprophyticus]|uniref:tyrosine-type recombinase/integrase n=1 Tax=Staphylococcus saprophyticus TaxID=29385 RepID=UPI001011B1A1|nr:site-specific integrase [Staphylococcus saprophyticus]MDW3933565.1 tyrosine-type recombinase/integrase [Staphylococcus saprophyticus]RXS23191.1 site-specific integrase [Staphylococcus saprophyticus]
MNVTKRSGKWQYDFRYNNKRYRKGSFKTKKDATIAGNSKYNELINGYNISDDNSFISYYYEWVRVNKENKVSQTTLNRYLASGRAFEEKFGNTPINKISQLKYREFLNEYAEGKYLTPRKEGRAKGSVKKLHNCLSGAFADAINEKLITKDPTYKAEPHGVKKEKSEKDKFMNLTDYKKLKSYVSDSYELSYLFIYVLIATGARFKEIQHLKYSDIDQVKQQIHLPGTKSENAERTIAIAKNDLKHILNILDNRPRNMGGYIFNTGATLISNNAVTKTLRKFLLENKIGNYTLHALRHTHASMLLSEGLSIQYVSKRLGHANIEITWRVYSHLLEEQKLEEDSMLDSALANF